MHYRITMKEQYNKMSDIRYLSILKYLVNKIEIEYDILYNRSINIKKETLEL